MIYPPALHPTDTERILLPSGRHVDVPKACPQFGVWTQKPVLETYGGKAILDFEGRPVFAELAILHLLKEAGWQAVWIDTYRRVYRDGFCEAMNTIALPPERERLMSALRGLQEGAVPGTSSVGGRMRCSLLRRNADPETGCATGSGGGLVSRLKFVEQATSSDRSKRRCRRFIEATRSARAP